MGGWLGGSVGEDTCWQSDDLGSIPVADMVEVILKSWPAGVDADIRVNAHSPTRISKQTNKYMQQTFNYDRKRHGMLA